MFYGHPGQASYDAEIRSRLRDYEQRQRQYEEDEQHQQRLAFMRSAVVGAVQAAPPGLFQDFAVEAAAEAAVRAGMRQS